MLVPAQRHKTHAVSHHDPQGRWSGYGRRTVAAQVCVLRALSQSSAFHLIRTDLACVLVRWIIIAAILEETFQSISSDLRPR